MAGTVLLADNPPDEILCELDIGDYEKNNNWECPDYDFLEETNSSEEFPAYFTEALARINGKIPEDSSSTTVESEEKIPDSVTRGRTWTVFDMTSLAVLPVFFFKFKFSKCQKLI